METRTSTAPPSNLLEVTYNPLKYRGLRESTCRKFGYGTGLHSGDDVQIANYRDPKGKIVAQKIRTRDKKFKILGAGQGLGLWGSHLWSKGRMLVITEGEVDCLSVSQAQDDKWPVCSVANGAAGAARCIKQNLEYLEQFDQVIFMFDMDKAGQDAAAECAILLTPGKAKIAALPLNDPNEMLLANRSKEIISAIWNARVYRPDGVIPGAELWDRVVAETDKDSIAYPWTGLNQKTYGIRRGEVVVLTSGTGQGKSSICRTLQKDLIDQGHPIGIVALEENVAQTAQHLMGLQLKVPPHRWAEQGVTEADKRTAFESTLGGGNAVLYDHFGSLESNTVLSRIRYMVVGMGCTHIFLDHLSIVVSGMEGGDERRAIDLLMTKLRSMVEELQFSLFIVSHLKRPEGRSHEEGGQVSLAHLRGSGAIAQLSDICIGLERDQQDEDRRHITTIRVLKNRYTGDTGAACDLRYCPETGLIHEHYDEHEETDTPF